MKISNKYLTWILSQIYNFFLQVILIQPTHNTDQHGLRIVTWVTSGISTRFSILQQLFTLRTRGYSSMVRFLWPNLEILIQQRSVYYPWGYRNINRDFGVIHEFFDNKPIFYPCWSPVMKVVISFLFRIVKSGSTVRSLEYIARAPFRRFRREKNSRVEWNHLKL